jgi:electron transport complex protein RnfB
VCWDWSGQAAVLLLPSVDDWFVKVSVSVKVYAGDAVSSTGVVCRLHYLRKKFYGVRMSKEAKNMDRRGFLREGVWGGMLAGIGALGGFLARKSGANDMVWQIDPYTCIGCGNCATYCVLEESAVKCVHAYAVCGYCEICFGYFGAEPANIDTGAENQLCPTGAIGRTFIEDPYYEYHIDEDLCNGCGKCVEGCNAFGNGSLFLQVRHDRCVNCNECSIAAACPTGAFRRVNAKQPYIVKNVGHA